MRQKETEVLGEILSFPKSPIILELRVLGNRADGQKYKQLIRLGTTGRNHCKQMVIMEERMCFVKFKPRFNPENGSHCIWHYLVHIERDNSFFWLKQECDSLDFQVF